MMNKLPIAALLIALCSLCAACSSNTTSSIKEQPIGDTIYIAQIESAMISSPFYVVHKSSACERISHTAKPMDVPHFVSWRQITTFTKSEQEAATLSDMINYCSNCFTESEIITLCEAYHTNAEVVIE